MTPNQFLSDFGLVACVCREGNRVEQITHSNALFPNEFFSRGSRDPACLFPRSVFQSFVSSSRAFLFPFSFLVSLFFLLFFCYRRPSLSSCQLKGKSKTARVHYTATRTLMMCGSGASCVFHSAVLIHPLIESAGFTLN